MICEASNRSDLSRRRFFLSNALPVIACLAVGSPAPAAEPAPRSSHEIGLPFFRNFRPKEYGAHPQNWCIIQDHRGLIYAGNNDGVLEFDGVYFRLIRVANGTAVRSLAADGSGRIFAGANGELGVLEPDDLGHMQYVSWMDRIPSAERDFGEVYQTFVTTEGIVFSTRNRIFRVGREVQVWRAPTAFSRAHALGERLLVREVGRGLMELVGNEWQLLPGGGRFADEFVSAVLPAESAGSLVIGTRGQGIFLFDGTSFNALPTEIDDILKRGQLRSVARLVDGSLAVGTGESGLYLLDPHGRFRTHLATNEGLPSNNIVAMFQDRQGGLWLALDKGITRVEPGDPITTFIKSNGMDSTVVSLHRHGGSLFAGSNAGLARLVTESGGNAKFVPIPEIRSQTWTFLSAGSALLVGNFAGVYEIQDDGPNLVRPSIAALSLCRSRRDPSRVFVGLQDGLAVMRWDGGRWKDEGRIPGIADQIRSLVETADGRLWGGAYAAGVFRLSFPEGSSTEAPSIERFGIGQGLPDLKSNNVVAIDGDLVFATRRGLFRFDEATRRFAPDPRFVRLFPEGPRLVRSVTKDVRGWIWMVSTDEARAYVECGAAVPDSGGSYHWEPRPLGALLGSSVNTIHSDDDGVMWFGGSDGLFRYDPGVSKDYNQPFAALVRKVTGTKDKLFFGGSGAGTSPKLAYEDNGLRFEFAAPSFAGLEAIRFQTRLEGEEQDWSPWSTEPHRIYSNLSEGSYKFRVRARNAYGTLSEEGSFAFTIQPPWYRTWWAYGGYLLLVGVVGEGLFLWRVRALKRRTQSLEADITERKRLTDELVRMNRLYSTISRVNCAMVQAKDRKQLLTEICNILVKEGRFKVAWIAWHDPADKSLKPFVVAGDEQDYVSKTRISSDPAAPGGQGPTAICFRSERTYVCNDFLGDPATLPWRESARQSGFHSSISLPIKLEGRTTGVLVVYAGAKDFFGPGEVGLLEETANDLSFALEVLAREAKRHESEERFRALAESSLVGIYVLQDGHYTYVNPAMAGIFGYSVAEMTGMTPRDIVDPEELERVAENIRRRIDGEVQSMHYEVRGRYRDGSARYVEVYGSRIVMNGKPALVGTLIDITERKRTEEAVRASERQLRESQATLRTIIDSTSDLVWAVDPDSFGLITFNERIRGHYLKEYGIRLASGMTPSDLFPKREWITLWEDMYRRALREGPFVTEYVGYSGAITMELSFSLLKRDFQLFGIAVFGKDITERKKAEVRLREQAALLDQASDAIFVTNFDNRLTYWNRSAARLFGWTVEEVVGQRPEDLFIRFPIAQVTEIRELLLERGHWNGEIVLRNRKDEPVHIDLRATLARDAGGQPRGRMLVCTDITEKKKIQEQFLRAQRLESVGMLAAGIAHDLNNVLAPVGMISDLLRKQYPEEKNARLFDTLNTCAQRGSGLIRQILGFAHGIGGANSVIQVKHLLRDVAQMSTETFPKNIHIEAEIPNDLWTISCNPTQIHQVLLNLCVNARDAMPDGGTLTLRAENSRLDDRTAQSIPRAQPGNWLLLHVADTGTGMSPETCARIWEPFFTTKPLDKGTGLGLSTVRGIVETHHGFVTVDTELGRGTTFRVYLPAAETPSPAVPEEQRTATAHGHGEGILVVDDEATIRVAAEETLSGVGYRVATAADGAKAVALMEKSAAEFGLVITDLEMPALDGASLARQIRCRHPATKILMMSGKVGNWQAHEANPTDFADAFLTKPFTVEKLLKAVEQLLHAQSTKT